MRDRSSDGERLYFRAIREMVRRHAGIQLSDAKRELVYGRLRKRLRALSPDAPGASAWALDVWTAPREIEVPSVKGGADARSQITELASIFEAKILDVEIGRASCRERVSSPV